MSDAFDTGAFHRVGFRYHDQFTPPDPEQVTDVAITTFEHVFEVDPRLMQQWVLQQTFPNWDTLRIMRARGDHLAWMHRHFAHTVVTGSELLAEIEGTAPDAVGGQAGSETGAGEGKDHR